MAWYGDEQRCIVLKSRGGAKNSCEEQRNGVAELCYGLVLSRNAMELYRDLK
ncbi:MAG: hypothetical protein ACI4RG_05915 [Huintestinicola sp.]